MKTILYNPIFINPQAYYVFPRLTRYLQPDNESTAEPANYIGTIEVKVIAYGDTTLKRTYTNTDSIDLSEFKNTWIRISLFTKVGSCVLGEWKIGNMESDLPYIDPEVLASLKAVVIVGNKTNNDSDRAIIKNLVDPDNPFIISNAAFKLNSGFGKYEEDFTDWRIYPNIKVTDSVVTTDGNFKSGWFIYKHSSESKINEMNIKVSGIPKGGKILYFYISDETANLPILYTIPKDGIYHLPESKINNNRASVGFTVESSYDWNNIRIEQIPSFEGAFVTDGIDDLITSTKTVQEMLGGSNEITVVSLITHISGTGKYNIIGDGGIQVSDYSGQTFMAGTSSSGEKIVELGDKEKLQAVQYTTFDSKLTIGLEDSSYAYYGTFVFNKENVPVDWIHQVIAYFNLDRTLNPDILCNTIKQGITNENHAEFGDKLIDFSGNGRDIQLNNIAWKGDSGIGKYETDFTTWTRSHFTDEVNFTPSKIEVTGILTTNSILINNKPTPIYNVEIHSPNKSIVVYYQYNDDTGVKRIALVDGINELPSANDSLFVTSDRLNSKGITITQIPSHAGALCLDGVNDFGKVTGMPIYKDYTVIADYERFYLEPITGGRASILSKSSKVGDGSFIFNLENQDGSKACYTFGEANGNISDDITRIIRYQSKYYNTKTLSIGTAEDNDFMVLGKVREVDSRHFCGAIYSLMSFPYSMSEFLIERQLKKHKLGTLYPDMVEWRPIIKSNVEYASISYLLRIPGQGTVTPVIGQYYPILSTDTSLVVYVATNGVDEVANLTINGQEPTSSSIHVDGRFKFEFPFNNSPQKINITIDEYIRYEDIDFTNCYPGVPHIYVNDKSVTWGDKLKVGDEFTFYGNVNILPEMYNVLVKALYNGEEMVYGSIGTISKSMVFTSFKTYIFDDNEPKCILSPRLLSIPNSSYKILGYIPDISGHGNNGVIHNSAYTEGSGVNEDGSYQFDGVDDFVTIPTVTGGKQVLMKVNWQSDVGAVTLYDQRLNISDYEFAIYNGTRDLDDNPVMAYQGRNNGQTYIDGILNSNIMASELKAITHNITITNELSLGINNTYPVIGSTKSNTHFAQMSLYDFMLFDEISTDEEILTLNEYVGIEGNTDDLFN